MFPPDVGTEAKMRLPSYRSLVVATSRLDAALGPTNRLPVPTTLPPAATVTPPDVTFSEPLPMVRGPATLKPFDAVVAVSRGIWRTQHVEASAETQAQFCIEPCAVFKRAVTAVADTKATAAHRENDVVAFLEPQCRRARASHRADDQIG